MLVLDGETRSAVISECGNFRYELHRVWAPLGHILTWVMLNPSTADAYQDDATIRRVRGFTKREGYVGFSVVNIFAYRATSPKDLHANRPGGRDLRNEQTIREQVHERDVVVAWGNNVGGCPAFSHAKMIIQEHAKSIRCLGMTKGQRAAHGQRVGSQPRHPVRLPKDTPLVPWSP